MRHRRPGGVMQADYWSEIKPLMVPSPSHTTLKNFDDSPMKNPQGQAHLNPSTGNDRWVSATFQIVSRGHSESYYGPKLVRHIKRSLCAPTMTESESTDTWNLDPEINSLARKFSSSFSEGFGMHSSYAK